MQFLIAPYGFHVGDDGVTLNLTRRVFVDGEIPHRDFFHLRPAGSSFLWLPFFVLRDWIHLTTRSFVIIQYALIVLFWMKSYENIFSFRETSELRRFSIFLISFACAVALYPIFPFYNTDGLFWCSFGIFLKTLNRNQWLNLIGSFVLGIGTLAKQNFFGAVILSWVFFKEWRKPQNILASILPLVLYILIISVNGGGEDLKFQMSVYSIKDVFIPHGILPVLANKSFYRGIILGLLIAFSPYLIERVKRFNLNKAIVFNVLVWIVFIYLNINIIKGKFAPRFPVFFLGFLSTFFFYKLFKEKERDFQKVLFFPLVVGVGWLTCFSLTWNFPHSAGFIFAVSLLFLVDHFKQFDLQKSLVVLSLLTFSSFLYARMSHDYDYVTAAKYNLPAGEIYPGAKGMKLGKTVHLVSSELNSLVKKYETKENYIIILPNFVSFWPAYKQRNIFPNIWTMQLDINHPKIVNELLASLEKMRPGTIVIFEDFAYETLHFVGKDEVIKPRNFCKEIEQMHDILENTYTLVEKTNLYEVFRK